MTSTLTEDLCAFSAILDETASSSPDAEEYLNLLAPRCLVWSALFLYLDSYCCPEKLGNEPGYPITGNAKTPEEQFLQVNATLVVRSISDQAHNAALRIAQILDGCLQTQGNFRRISPFVLDALYCTMATFHWVLREGGDDTIRLSLQDVKQCLRRLGEGWPLALEYLALEDVYATAPADE
ncbi:hypothetical protein N7471_006700 [Penicillium samsonianum]|uniref:uncharacterized protein n=1 Tax=Penicillium samsonianum TaxID=1882272 RepID=UPI0025469B50|nr:uncharacterized protein N7471_006700 [Penicillium samsonianum]KAJ6140214.1 hypothetical protein N7471_006700 [Penicillium samsonianum]